MADEVYEAPQITVLGDVTDMTLSKPGIYFDMPGSAEGGIRTHRHRTLQARPERT